MQEAWVWSLIRELRSHKIPHATRHGQKKERGQNHISYTYNDFTFHSICTTYLFEIGRVGSRHVYPRTDVEVLWHRSANFLKGQTEIISGFVSQEAKLSILRSDLYNRSKCSYLKMQKPFLACTVYQKRQQIESGPWAVDCWGLF